MSDERIRQIAGETELDPEVQQRLDEPIQVTLAGSDPRWSRQVTALCLVDLLARLLPRILVEHDPQARADALLPPGPALLAERFAAARAHALIDPQDPDGQDPVLTVVVGREPEGADIYVDGSGWVSFLGDRPPQLLPDERTNPIGPLAAACRGASQVIQRLLGDLLPVSSRVECSYWSAIAMTASGEPPGSVGPPLGDPEVDALLMGAGSIGGAAVYALARVPRLRGTLRLVDPDDLENLNSRKALLARRPDIQAEKPKIDVAEAELAHLDELAAPKLKNTLAEWVSARPASEPLPLVLCAVDSIHARRELADHMPLEAINSACGDTHIHVSGHRTDDGPCIYCLYLEQVLDANAARGRMIVRETGLPPRTVAELREKETPLAAQHLTVIERRRRLPAGSLAAYIGRTLDQLFDEELLYGELQLEDQAGRRSALQLAFVPALAGVLLAGELLKTTTADVTSARLGPAGSLHTAYSESLLHEPVGLLTDPPRWPTSECLCASPRRLALMRVRYGLAG